MKEVIYKAIDRGDVAQIERLLGQDKNLINLVSDDGSTALHYAARQGQLKVVKYLISKGMDPKKLTTDGKELNALDEAILHDQLEVIDYFMIELNIQSTIKTDCEGPIQHCFALDGQALRLKYFMDQYNIPLGDKDNTGFTTLHCAVRNGHPKCVEVILKHPNANYNDSKQPQNKVTLREFVNLADNKGITALHFAAGLGDIGSVKLLLISEADLQAKDERGCNALDFAIIDGHLEAVKLFDSLGLKPTLTTPQGGGIVHYLTRYGKLPILNYYIGKKISLRIEDNIGATPLHYAAANGQIEYVDLLLNHPDANYDELTKAEFIDKTTSNGSTALHYAARQGKLKVVKYLISKGIDPKKVTKDEKKLNALDEAILHDQWEVIDFFMIELKIQSTIKTDCEGPMQHCFALNGQALRLKYFMDKYNIPLGDKDNIGFTTLHCAVRKGHPKCVEVILEHPRANYNDSKQPRKNVTLKEFVNLADAKGKTALHFAAGLGDMDSIKLLLKSRADLRAKDERGCNALDFALIDGHFEAVKLFDSLGLKPTLTTPQGGGILHYLIRYGKLPILNYYIGKEISLRSEDNIGATPLHYAAANGQIEYVDLLLNHPDANYDELTKAEFINKTTNDGSTALHYAARQGKLKAVKYLISQGIDPKKVTKDGKKLNALDVAILHDQLEVIDYFMIELHIQSTIKTDCEGPMQHSFALNGQALRLKYFMDQYNIPLGDRDNIGFTTLHCAVRKGHPKCVEVILKHPHGNYNDSKQPKKIVTLKEFVNLADAKGKTALHFAAGLGDMDSIKLLLISEADLQAKDERGCNALDFAIIDGCLEVVKLFDSLGLKPTLTTPQGGGILHYLARYGKLPILNYYIAQKISLRIEDNIGATPLHYAAANGQIEYVDLLLNHPDANYDELTKAEFINKTTNDGSTALHYAVSNGNIEIIKFLLTNAANLDSKDKNDINVIDKAIDANQLEAVKFLSEQGLSPATYNRDGKFIAHILAEQGQDQILSFYINQGLALATTDKDGATALHYAVKNRHFSCVQLILELPYANYTDYSDPQRKILTRKEMLNKTYEGGYTVLHIAAENGDIALLEYLINQGADFSAINKDGWNIADYAASKQQYATVKWLSDRFQLTVNHSGHQKQLEDHPDNLSNVKVFSVDEGSSVFIVSNNPNQKETWKVKYNSTAQFEFGFTVHVREKYREKLTISRERSLPENNSFENIDKIEIVIPHTRITKEMNKSPQSNLPLEEHKAAAIAIIGAKAITHFKASLAKPEDRIVNFLDNYKKGAILSEEPIIIKYGNLTGVEFQANDGQESKDRWLVENPNRHYVEEYKSLLPPKLNKIFNPIERILGFAEDLSAGKTIGEIIVEMPWAYNYVTRTVDFLAWAGKISAENNYPTRLVELSVVKEKENDPIESKRLWNAAVALNVIEGISTVVSEIKNWVADRIDHHILLDASNPLNPIIFHQRMLKAVTSFAKDEKYRNEFKKLPQGPIKPSTAKEIFIRAYHDTTKKMQATNASPYLTTLTRNTVETLNKEVSKQVPKMIPPTHHAKPSIKYYQGEGKKLSSRSSLKNKTELSTFTQSFFSTTTKERSASLKQEQETRLEEIYRVRDQKEKTIAKAEARRQPSLTVSVGVSIHGHFGGNSLNQLVNNAASTIGHDARHLVHDVKKVGKKLKKIGKSLKKW